MITAKVTEVNPGKYTAEPFKCGIIVGICVRESAAKHKRSKRSGENKKP